MNKNCVFCKIVAGKLPCYKVYEDKDFLGFLSIEPLNPGHTILIPKKHYRWVDQVPDFGVYFETARKIGEGIKKALKPFTICYFTLGFMVKHAHIWIVPRFENDGHRTEILWKNIKKIPEQKMREIAGSISNRVIK